MKIKIVKMQKDNLNPLHENSCTCYMYGHQGYNHTQVLLVWVLVIPFSIASMEISQFSRELQAYSVLMVWILILTFFIVSMEIFRFSWVTTTLGPFCSGSGYDFLYCERKFLNSHALFILVFCCKKLVSAYTMCNNVHSRAHSCSFSFWFH